MIVYTHICEYDLLEHEIFYHVLCKIDQETLSIYMYAVGINMYSLLMRDEITSLRNKHDNLSNSFLTVSLLYHQSMKTHTNYRVHTETAYNTPHWHRDTYVSCHTVAYTHLSNLSTFFTVRFF